LEGLPSIANRIEVEFLHPVLLGQSILPYRIFKRFEAVVLVTAKGKVLDAAAALARGCDGLHGWMSKSEAAWNEHRTTQISLVQQFDYYGKLAAQFPLAPLRVVYAKAGTQPKVSLKKPPLLVSRGDRNGGRISMRNHQSRNSSKAH
jgi:hypothetical protein